MAALRDQAIMVVNGRMVHDAEEVLIDDAVLKRCKIRTICALNMAFLLEKTNEQVIPAGELPGLSQQLVAGWQAAPVSTGHLARLVARFPSKPGGASLSCCCGGAPDAATI